MIPGVGNDLGIL